MIKQLPKSQRSDVKTLPSNIHNLSNADFSDESDSDSDHQVVMLSWNNGKVSKINLKCYSNIRCVYIIKVHQDSTDI